MIENKKMDACTCSCGEGSSTQVPTKYSFPKKLLVATTLVVVIAMCLTPAEARTMEHKIRHERRHESLTHPTKEISRPKMAEPRLEKRRPHKKNALTKDSPAFVRQRNALADRFKNAMTKIKKKLKNTRTYFNEERRVLNETRDYREGMPSWLPAINFVDIHFHNYKIPRRTGASISERKFTYLMPKLYKSMVEFQSIFKHLSQVEVNFADDPFYAYNKTRQELLTKTINRLESTIAEIRENMIRATVPVPNIGPNKNINALNLKVDAPQCLKNDYIAFRAYGNLLNNWYLEFRCPYGKKVINDKLQCAMYEEKLKVKKESRVPKAKKAAS